MLCDTCKRKITEISICPECIEKLIKKFEKRLNERKEAIAIARRICLQEDFSNDWPDDLHLADIIEKRIYNMAIDKYNGLKKFMDTIKEMAQNRNPDGYTILDFMVVWNEQYERRIKELEQTVRELLDVVDGRVPFQREAFLRGKQWMMNP